MHFICSNGIVIAGVLCFNKHGSFMRNFTTSVFSICMHIALSLITSMLPATKDFSLMMTSPLNDQPLNMHTSLIENHVRVKALMSTSIIKVIAALMIVQQRT